MIFVKPILCVLIRIASLMNRLAHEGILMKTHNIGFYEEISKIIPYLSSNMHLISSSVIFIFLSSGTVYLQPNRVKRHVSGRGKMANGKTFIYIDLVVHQHLRVNSGTQEGTRLDDKIVKFPSGLF